MSYRIVVGLMGVAMFVAGGCGALLGFEDLTGDNLTGGGGTGASGGMGGSGGVGAGSVGGTGAGGGITCEDFPAWSLGFPGEGVQEEIFVATPRLNGPDVTIAGSYLGTPDFGNGPLPQADEESVYIASYTSAGRLIFAKSFGSANSQQLLRGLTVDENGSIYVMGYFKGTLAFGGNTPPLNGNNNNNLYDLFVAKLDAEGNPEWSKAYQTAGQLFEPIRGAIGVSGDALYVAGSVVGLLTAGARSFQAMDVDEMFLLSMSREGLPLDGWLFSGLNSQVFADMFVAPDGSLYLAGAFHGEVKVAYNEGSPEDLFGFPGVDDLFMLRVLPGATPTYETYTDGGPGSETGLGIAVTDGGVAAVVGTYSGGSFSNRFGADYPSTEDGGNEGVYFFVDPDSTFEAGGGFSAPGNQELNAVAALGNDVVVTGHFVGDVGIGSKTVSAPTGLDADDIVLAQLTTSANHVWATSYGDDGYQKGSDVAVDPCGAIYLAGVNDGTVDFGTGPITATSGRDLFLARIIPPPR